MQKEELEQKRNKAIRSAITKLDQAYNRVTHTLEELRDLPVICLTDLPLEELSNIQHKLDKSLRIMGKLAEK